MIFKKTKTKDNNNPKEAKTQNQKNKLLESNAKKNKKEKENIIIPTKKNYKNNKAKITWVKALIQTLVNRSKWLNSQKSYQKTKKAKEEENIITITTEEYINTIKKREEEELQNQLIIDWHIKEQIEKYINIEYEKIKKPEKLQNQLIEKDSDYIKKQAEEYEKKMKAIALKKQQDWMLQQPAQEALKKGRTK